MESLKQPIDSTFYSIHDSEDVIGESGLRYVMKIKDRADNQRPREKLIKIGPDSLSSQELLSVVLGVGTKKEEVITMSARILKEYGESMIATETNASRLASVLNLPLVKACQVIACFELGRRFFEVNQGKAVFVSTPQQAHSYLKDMSLLQKEQLRGLYLNSRYRVIYEEAISIGSMTASIVHPREVFRPAIEYGAVAVILAHNHPSGSLEPTLADSEVTERLVVASKILGIDLLDHIIVSSTGFKSILKNE